MKRPLSNQGGKWTNFDLKIFDIEVKLERNFIKISSVEINRFGVVKRILLCTNAISLSRWHCLEKSSRADVRKKKLIPLNRVTSHYILITIIYDRPNQKHKSYSKKSYKYLNDWITKRLAYQM